MPKPRKYSLKKSIIKSSAKSSLFSKLETDVESNQSKVSLILGALIVLVLGILVFNYFNKSKPSLGPAQQTSQETQQQPDVTADQLPGKYTIKEGDTLFTVAEKYFKDGYKYIAIAKANNIINPDEVKTGQVLEIPKIAAVQQPEVSTGQQTLGTGGGNSTIWGPRIEGTTYTVVEGDWLSKIAGRAYGDIMAFEKIAKANNISDPDHIEPGQVLTIPR